MSRALAAWVMAGALLGSGCGAMLASVAWAPLAEDRAARSMTPAPGRALIFAYQDGGTSGWCAGATVVAVQAGAAASIQTADTAAYLAMPRALLVPDTFSVIDVPAGLVTLTAATVTHVPFARSVKFDVALEQRPAEQSITYVRVEVACAFQWVFYREAPSFSVQPTESAQAAMAKGRLTSVLRVGNRPAGAH